MIKTFYTIILAFVATMFISSCAYAVRYDGPYKGQIIDADTGQPLKEVVVLGVWYKEEPTVAGAVSTYYDARETITGTNGDFEIPGQGLRIMTNLAPMNVLIFKAGYTKYDMIPWDSLERIVKFKDKKPIIRLRKLTMEQRKKQGFPIEPMAIPDNKMKLMREEVNKERAAQGYSPL